MIDLPRIVRERWSERKAYSGRRSWVLSLYNRLLRRAGCRLSPGPGRVVRVWLAAEVAPFFVRLGSTDWLVLEELFMRGEYSPPGAAGLGDVLLVVDLGANIGLSIRLWQKWYPGAAIIAVEPDASNLETCRLNTAGGVPSG